MPSSNPRIALHMQGEMDYTGGGYSRARARQLVLGEYAGAPPAIRCQCGGTAHYRATVGVRMCPTCRTMYRGDGTKVGG